MRHRRTRRRRSSPARASAGWCVAALVAVSGMLMSAAGVVHHWRGQHATAGVDAPLAMTALDDAVARASAPDTRLRAAPPRPSIIPRSPASASPFEPAPARGTPPTPPPPTAEATFDHRPLRHARTIRMRVTAYSPDARSCGKWADGQTASGYSVWTNGMRLVAADTDVLPFGSVISIPGYHDGEPVPVLDRGGAIRGRRLDVLFPTHERALQWGVRDVDVTVWAYADE